MRIKIKVPLAILTIAVMMLGFYSCDSDDDNDNFTLVVNPTELIFDNIGGELILEISTDYDSPEVTTNLSWITASKVEGSKNWKIKAQANAGNDKREGTLVVKAGSLTNEVTITQLAREQFSLPYFAEDLSREQVEAYELSRKSIIDEEESNEDFLLYYSLNDDVWSDVLYEWDINNPTGNYLSAGIFTKKVELFEDISHFDAFALSKGFTKVSSNYYRHNEFEYGLFFFNFVEHDDGEHYVVVAISYMPRQDKAYPTFSELPIFPQINHINDGNGVAWTFEDVSDYESGLTDGAHFNGDRMPNAASYEVTTSSVNYERQYWFDISENGKLDYFFYRTNEIEKVSFKHKGKYYLTDELIELMSSNGLSLYYVSPLDYEYSFSNWDGHVRPNGEMVTSSGSSKIIYAYISLGINRNEVGKQMVVFDVTSE